MGMASEPGEVTLLLRQWRTGDRHVEGRLFELLMTQQADGSFRLSPVLQQWLGQRWPAVQAAAGHHGEALVATAVVVALLAREAANRADEWGPAVAKAQHWLAQQGQHIAVETLL